MYGYPAFTMIVDQDGASLGSIWQKDMRKQDRLFCLTFRKRSGKTTQERRWKRRQLSAFLSLALMASLPGHSAHCRDGLVTGTAFSSKSRKQFVDEVNRDEWFAMLLFALVLVASGVQFIYFSKKAAGAS